MTLSLSRFQKPALWALIFIHSYSAVEMPSHKPFGKKGETLDVSVICMLRPGLHDDVPSPAVSRLHSARSL